MTPELLGMQQVVSEDTVRRALTAIEETPGVDWLHNQRLSACFIALSRMASCFIKVISMPVYYRC